MELSISCIIDIALLRKVIYLDILVWQKAIMRIMEDIKQLYHFGRKLYIRVYYSNITVIYPFLYQGKKL